MINKTILLLLIFPLFAWAAKPTSVECIAPASAGGGWDFTCRVPAAQVMRNLKLVRGNVKVTNMAGAGGGKAYAYVVSKRAKDSNLIIAASMATATRLGQNVYTGLAADDVRWLGALGADYGVLAVSKDSPIQNLDQLIAKFKSNPESTTIVGGSAAGGWDHLKVLILANKAGIKNLKQIKYISFNSGGKALLEVIGKRADVFTGDTSEILDYFDAGDIRILAVLSPERIARLKDSPTANEQGYDVTGANWRGFYAPRKIRKKRYNEWVDVVRATAQSPEWAALREKHGLASFESFGEEFEGFVKEQITLVHNISKELGLIQ